MTGPICPVGIGRAALWLGTCLGRQAACAAPRMACRLPGANRGVIASHILSQSSREAAAQPKGATRINVRCETRDSMI